ESHEQLASYFAEQAYQEVKELEVRKERLQALAHLCGVYTMEQIEEALEQEGCEATVARLTAALGVKQGSREIPAD
ncbi:hypothetical protein, partial [Paenibacillus popilliae]